MWLNDFRTDKETLIEWQPGNVLMKDTQGVVSSEDICYSCHDGYVSDSRYKAWKYNNHKVFVKPSDKVAVPSVLPLSNKDEIYCGTCHTAHGFGAIAEGSLPGPNSFMRVTNVASNMCEMCHTNQTDFKRTNGHPLKASTLKLPDILFELGARRAGDRNQVICQSCHQVHGARGDPIVIVDNKNSELCTTCHVGQQSLNETKHDLRLTLPEAKNSKEQLPSQSGPCGACHAPHRAAGRWLWARAVKPGNPASQMCLTCHGEDDTGYKIKGVGEYTHPIDVERAAKTPITSGLPLFLTDGTENSAGKVECFTCHNVHRWDPDSLTNRGEKNVDGDASNSFLRISSSLSSALCVDCHRDKSGLIASDHNLAITAPEDQNLRRVTPRVSGPCGACHLAHNAAGDKLWARRLSGDKDFVTQLCTGCHNRDGAAREKLIGENYHPVDVPLNRVNTGETGADGVAKLPLYDSRGDEKPDGNLVCVTCHEPHVWDPKQPEGVVDQLFQNTEGDATNSFLRKANFPSSNLCKACHLAQADVDGTEHDLNVSAPKATNLLEQTVKASGQCGACHLVHNSPNRLKLWARPYGPVPREQNIMSGLCTSCHSEGNVAEKQTPRVATHPPGKLITNIMYYSKDKKSYTVIFDKNGKETNVGDLSCPSCHNAHRRGPPFEERRGPKDNGGNETATYRFLRIMSYDAVCKDCHGQDSILRYLYFHDPDQRSQAAKARAGDKFQFWR
jgi:predicted CXXCH cytochrome family protein